MLEHSDRRSTRHWVQIGPPLRGCAVQSRGSVASLYRATSPLVAPRLPTGLHSTIKVSLPALDRL